MNHANELKVQEQGVTTVAIYDPITHGFIVESHSPVGGLRTMHSMEMIMNNKSMMTDESPLEFCIRIHKMRADFYKLVPSVQHVAPSDSISIKINMVAKEHLMVDFTKVQAKIKELVEKEIPKTETTMDIQKILGPAKWNESGITPKPLSYKDLMNETQAFKNGGPVKSSKGYIVDYTDSGFVKELARIFKGLDVEVKHPETGIKANLPSIIVNLNDNYGWSRNKIADWIESLDVDTSIVTEDELV